MTLQWRLPASQRFFAERLLTAASLDTAGPAFQPMPKQPLPATASDPGWHE